MRRLQPLLGPLLALGLGARLYAQTPPKPIEEIDLADLLKTKVTTATKTEAVSGETPVIIEVITHEQIRQRGYRHLADVLNDLPDNHEDRGNWGIGEPLNQNVGFGFRFDTGQNILLLFNGHRLNAFMPGNRFGGEEYLLDDVERIEIIRGAGSTLYGANAFTVVVNVMSRDRVAGKDKGQVRGAVGGIATSAGVQAEGSWDSRVGAEGFTSGAFRVAREGGQRLLIENALFGDLRTRDGVNHSVDGEAFFSRKALRLSVKAFHQVRKTFTGFNGVNPDTLDQLTLRGYGYYIGGDYTFKLGSSVGLKIALGAHVDDWTEVALVPLFKLNEDGTGLLLDDLDQPILDTVSVTRDGRPLETSFVIDGQGAETLTLDGEAQLTWRYNEKNNLVFGVNPSRDSIRSARRPSEIQLSPPGIVPFRNFTDDANNWLFDTQATRRTVGVYGQIDYDYGERLSLSGGARLDSYTGSGALDQTYNAINPRAGLVYKSPNAGNFKLLYAKATRIPNGFETLSSVTILGSPANRPERIHLVQIAWEKPWSRSLSTQVGAFYSRLSNHLVTDAAISDQQRAQGYIGQFIDVPDQRLRSQGLEAQAHFKVARAIGHVNLTRYFNTDDGSGDEIPYIPSTMLNANVNLPLAWVNVNVNANYRSKFTHPRDDPRPPVDGYLLLGTTLTLKAVRRLEFRLGARNLLDADISSPSSSRDFIRHFPSRGIEVWGDVRFTAPF